MKKIVSLFMALVLVSVLWVPASAAAKTEKKVFLSLELPSGMEKIPFAGVPDLTGLTLVLTDLAGFTKRFLLPDSSDMLHYAFSDSEGTGSLEVLTLYGANNVGIVVYYETKNVKYIASYSPDWPIIPFDTVSIWNGSPFTAELIQGQTQKVAISQKRDVKGFVFTAAEYGWYSFNITGDTSGHPFISVRHLGNESHSLDFVCSYAHSVSLFLNSDETVQVAATTLGGYFTGSFNITAAPAVLSVPDETFKVRYHGIVPWSDILANTTYEPRALNIALSGGGFDPIAVEGWYAGQRGEHSFTILAPLETGEEASFNVKVEYDLLQWLCVIFLGGFIWMKWTPFSV